jgi:hypothetical protein
MSTVTITLVAVGVGLLAVVLAVVCAALVEVFRQLAEIRASLNLDDRALPLGLLNMDVSVTEIGLPEELATAPEVIVVFLSTKCATCLSIAEAFRGGAPSSVWFALQSDEAGLTKLTAPLERSSDRIVADVGGKIASRIGLDVTPSVLTVQYGQIVRAQAVSSVRQVLAAVPVVAAIGPSEGANGKVAEAV